MTLAPEGFTKKDKNDLMGLEDASSPDKKRKSHVQGRKSMKDDSG